MEEININDLKLIVDLSSRIYKDNTFYSNGNESERMHLRNITEKLRSISEYFSIKYHNIYGPFEEAISTGNPIAIGGKSFKRVWSGLFKGNTNKQYAAQISFVMGSNGEYLEVGFYFGRASGHSLDKEQKKRLEDQLKTLGKSLNNAIVSDIRFETKYQRLFDLGFSASNKNNRIASISWLNEINLNPQSCQITIRLYPNSFGVIEKSRIDYYVSELMFLMSAINNLTNNLLLAPLTPEQWAKQAERFAIIGLKGELYIFQQEKERLQKKGIMEYPKHVALESMHYGYDILTLDENDNEIYIEVKSTTRSKNDIDSRTFFLSNSEYQKYLQNENSYYLYRVYDVEHNPSYEILSIGSLKKEPNGYILNY